MLLTWSNLTLSTSNFPCSHTMVSNPTTRMIPFHTKRFFMLIQVKYGSLPPFIHLLGVKIKNQYSYKLHANVGILQRAILGTSPYLLLHKIRPKSLPTW